MELSTARYPLLRGALAFVVGVLFGAFWSITVVPSVAMGVWILPAVLVRASLYAISGATLLVSLYYVYKFAARPPFNASLAEIARGKGDGTWSTAGFALGYLLMWAALKLMFGGVMAL